MRVRLVAVLLLSAATACFAQASQATAEVKWGGVEGVVIDGDGKPLPGATVTSYSQAKGATRNVMQYQANEKGQFSLRVPEGKVWLSAHKDGDGYPYAFFAFYLTPGQQFPTMVATSNSPTSAVSAAGT